MEYSLVGFGGGPRFCLGSAFAQMEMKIFTGMERKAHERSVIYPWDISEPNVGLETVLTVRQHSIILIGF